MDAGPFHSLWHFDGQDETSWMPTAQQALAVLQRMPGFVEAHVGHSVDEPGSYFVHATWSDVGSYRRAVSSADSKMHVWPWLADVRNESSAFESLAVLSPTALTIFDSSVDGA